jgi:tetratricopeptide (TPR) repeat protein
MAGAPDSPHGGPVIGDLGGPPRPGAKPERTNPERTNPGKDVRDDKRAAKDDRDRDRDDKDKGHKDGKGDKPDGGKPDGGKPDGQPATEPQPTPPPSPSADALVKEGAKHFVAGKLKEALASFEMAKHRAPGYAPAYRGIGMVKQRMGDRSGAAAAYRKYLALAPKASDASSIRGKLEKLEQ